MLNNKRKVVLIAAVDLEGGFSKDGQIPWHYPEDFKWFKNRTSNNVCIMGRKTYDDINSRVNQRQQTITVEPGSINIATVPTLLPTRECFVVSSTLSGLPNATVIKQWWDVDTHLDYDDQRTINIIGGQQLFQQAIPLADQVILTVINDIFDCDRFFPVKYLMKHFTDTQTFKIDSQPVLRFVVWQRVSK